ncbi:MAG: thioredoxin domain-containing protein [Sulfurimonas sp.]|nr:thioredoxin domain-containing protein [Sulfurimonas sp.]MDD3060241.1 thioredoxin domain-containing protein [Sulfurimonas sp.]MDD5202723.1 thioredoxin domain-containing protein [Sulfurimonas sp.]
MLSMLKLLTLSTLLSSALFAATTNKEVEDFLEKSFKNNPNITSLEVKVVERNALDGMSGWEALIVSIDATLKAQPAPKQIKQKMVWFTDGTLITKELVNIKTGENLADSVSPAFKETQYKKENLIYGNANAKHKVAIFSDPLCPFCRSFVPGAIEDMKKSPELYALYYYHFPLASLHPASIELTKAAIAATLQGKKDAVLELYKIEINPNERDVNKILSVFNAAMKTDVKASDLTSKKVMEQYEYDMKLAEDLMVQGTPTLFYDGKMDKTKKQYLKAN